MDETAAADSRFLKKAGVAACILFHEKPDQTIECVESLLPSGIDIHILNNGSSRESRESLGAFCSGHNGVKIHDSDVNLGVSGGRNYLIAHTSEDWLFFLDNDIIVKTAEWRELFDHHARSDTDIEAFVPLLYNVHAGGYSTHTSLKLAGRHVTATKPRGNRLNKFPGGAAIISRRLFDRLGLYDEQMFVGLEDVELCIRALRQERPVRAMCVPDIELAHHHRAAQSEPDRRAIRLRYDREHLDASYGRLLKKHNVVYRDNYRKWAAAQAVRMAGDTGAAAGGPASGILGRLAGQLSGRRDHYAPRSCTLYMTDRCNFRCAGCSRNIVGVKRSTDMSVGVVEQLLSAYPGIRSFCIAGLGEPALCKNYGEVIDFLKARKKYVGIITNGSNIDGLLSLRYRPDSISISLYGHDDESYRKSTGLPVFGQVIDNYRRLKSKFRNVGFSCVLSKDTYARVDRIMELCDRLEPDFLHLINYLCYDVTNSAERDKIIGVGDREVIDHIEEACKGRMYVKIAPTYIDPCHPLRSCKSYYGTINLDGDGNIGGCQRHVPPGARFGNVFSDPDPYNSHEMRGLRDMKRNGLNPHDVCQYCFGNWA